MSKILRRAHTPPRSFSAATHPTGDDKAASGSSFSAVLVLSLTRKKYPSPIRTSDRAEAWRSWNSSHCVGLITTFSTWGEPRRSSRSVPTAGATAVDAFSARVPRGGSCPATNRGLPLVGWGGGPAALGRHNTGCQ